MKRPIYIISFEGKEIGRKSAWNTARLFVVHFVRGNLAPGQTAELFSTDFKQNPDTKAFMGGSEIWHTSDGRALVFTIERIDPPCLKSL